MSQVTPVLIPLPRAACKPWCARHDHSGGYCYSRDIPTPGGQWNAPGRIAMSSGPGGTLIEIHHDPDAELTPAEAEQFAHAILAQVRLA
ncbi:hypothetical protein [Nonomuraea sp. NPDC023979]|uniref:hypothetical protein n=1 Tax=Nonomuraea sp. NPDC023979 TaxID=3154796 RepID=UPI0033D1DB2D